MQIGLYSCRTLARFEDRRYAVLRDAGFDGLDLRINDKVAVIAAFPEDEYMAVVMRHKAMAEEAGIGIFQLHAPWTWPLENGTEDVTVRTEATKKVIRSAVILHCPYVVVHPLMPFGRDEENGKEAETWEANWEDFGKALIETGYPGTFCLESGAPHPKMDLDLAEEMLRFDAMIARSVLNAGTDPRKTE